MSTFNVLKTSVKCPNCENYYSAKIQFKYGDTWQYEYNLGDMIKWGGYDIGKPGTTSVKVYGILETDVCPICGFINNHNEFDLLVKDDVIISVNDIENANDYKNENIDFKNI